MVRYNPLTIDEVYGIHSVDSKRSFVKDGEEELIFVELTDGTKKYGKFVKEGSGFRTHRLHGPAVITKDVHEYWVDGLLHREDGPAVVGKSLEYFFIEEWWYEGQEYEGVNSKEELLMAVVMNG